MGEGKLKELLSHRKIRLRLGETSLLSVTLFRGYRREDMARLFPEVH